MWGFFPLPGESLPGESTKDALAPGDPFIETFPGEAFPPAFPGEPPLEPGRDGGEPGLPAAFGEMTGDTDDKCGYFDTNFYKILKKASPFSGMTDETKHEGRK